MDVQNVTRSSKWVCVKLRSVLHALQGSQITTQMDMLKSGENNNRAANPPGLNNHACAADVFCPHKGTVDTIKGAPVTHRNRLK